MNCVYCGAENPERSVFCKDCGRRLDGMALCGACGELTPADGAFCVHCGSNRNAPVYTMPLRFPVAESGSVRMSARRTAGAKSTSAGANKAEEQEGQESAVRGKTGKILSAVAFWCSAAAAVVGMIFVFLIGAAMNVGGVSAVNAGYDIFYFFGEAYETAVTEELASVAAVGTVCSVLALACTAACFVLTVVRFVGILLGKTKKGLIAPAAATFFAYVCGAAVFFLFMAQKTQAAGVSVGLGMNPATVAGIVIGAVLLVAAAVLRGIAAGVVGGVRTYVRNLVFGALIAVLLFVAVGLTGMGAISVSITTAGVSTGSTYGIYPFLTAIAASDQFGTCMALLAVLAVLACAFGAALAWACSDIFGRLGKRIAGRTLVVTGIAGAAAVLMGVMMCANIAVYIQDLTENFSADLAQPIILIVLGVLVCAAAVVYSVWSKRRADAPADGAAAVEADVEVDKEAES